MRAVSPELRTIGQVHQPQLQVVVESCHLGKKGETRQIRNGTPRKDLGERGDRGTKEIRMIQFRKTRRPGAGTWIFLRLGR